MKKIMIPILLITILLSVFLATPAFADAPQLENWEFASFNNHAAYCYYTINTTNLQVESFTIINNSNQPVRVRIYYDGWEDENVIFEMFADPHTNNWEPINGFKFHRLPLNDPDDPGSIRYPNRTYISARYG